MKNIVSDLKNQVNPNVKSKEVSNALAKEGKVALPDGTTLTLLMAMTMNPKDMRKMCARHCINLTNSDVHPGYELWGLHYASQDPDKSVAKDLRRYFRRRFLAAPSRVRSLEPEDLIRSIEDRQWPAPVLWAAGTDPRSEMRKQAQILTHSLIWNVIERCNQLRFGLSGLDQRVTEKKEVLEVTEKYCPYPKVSRSESLTESTLKRQIQKRDAEILDLKKKLALYSQELSELRQRPFREAGLRRTVKKLNYELEKANKRISEQERLIESYMMQIKNKKTTVEHTAPNQTDNVFTLLRPEDARGDCRHCTEQKRCHCPLEGMRVAIIGGLDRLEPEYRKTVRNLGADFIFHNGDCSNGRHVLKNAVCKSDIVLFITSVNSHEALKAVKATCKKTGKQFAVVRHPSARSIYKTLSKIEM